MSYLKIWFRNFEGSEREYGSTNGILGGHPDLTKVPGAEASTGSLRHGLPTATGLALDEFKKRKIRYFLPGWRWRMS